jgi:PadR family transcriptional regulator PadR
MEQQKKVVLPGTLNLKALKTPARSGNCLGTALPGESNRSAAISSNSTRGRFYPALLHLEQMGWISSKWGVSENNRRARYYSITRACKKQLATEKDSWRASEIMVRFF